VKLVLEQLSLFNLQQQVDIKIINYLQTLTTYQELHLLKFQIIVHSLKNQRGKSTTQAEKVDLEIKNKPL
jgi:competence transcription factor ComK